MQIINLTQHAIRIVTPAYAEGEPLALEVPPSGKLARVVQVDGALLPYHDEGPFSWVTRVRPPAYGEVEGLPGWEPGTVYLVSILVLQALKGKGRTDVYAPDTGPTGAVRDGAGKIVATTRLICAT